MPVFKGIQGSFTAGEISPALYSRVDTPKYRVALKEALNIIIHPHGGASNRSGLEFIGTVRNPAENQRLMTFDRSATISYVLEWGELYMRPIRDGGQILDTTTKAISGATLANPGVLTITGHGVVVDQYVYISGMTGMTHLNGGTFKVNSVPDANHITLKTLGGSVVDSTSFGTYISGGTMYTFYQMTAPYADDDVDDIVMTQEVDVGYLTHQLYAPRKLTRTGDANWAITTPTFAPSIAAPANAVAWTSDRDTTAPFNPAAMFYKVASISATTGEESLPTAALRIKTTSTSGIDDTNDLTVNNNTNTVQWDALAGAERYVVYKLDNGVYGYIGSTDAVSFIDDNITPDASDTPQGGTNPFSGAGDWPAVGTFFEQRLVFANTVNNPQAVYTSQSTAYENFGKSSPAKDSDAITFRLRARKVNEIRALLPLAKGLMLLTSGAEWIVNGGENGVLTPSQIVAQPQGYRGASKVQPVIVGNTVLFPQRNGGVVRDFSFNIDADQFTGSDLTILAGHLFEDRTIVAWGYAQSPNSVVWVVLDDGACLALTFIREHEVLAWTHIETDGEFKDVVVIPEGNEDVPYFIIERTVQGMAMRYIERLTSRQFTETEDAFFVDCGRTYSGAATDVITGLWHLEGSDVVALADGDVVENLTVVNGSVTLPYAAQIVHVGLPYTSRMATLELDMGMVRGMGTVQGRLKSIASVTVRVAKTRGISIGPDVDTLFPIQDRTDEVWGEATELQTGDYTVTLSPDWSTGAPIVIESAHPLPFTILGIMPEEVVGG